LTGVATRAGRDAALSNLGSVPSGIAVDTDISIADDGAPFGLRVVSDGDAAVASGKLPFGLAAASIGDQLDLETDASAVRQAEIGGDADLNTAISTGLTSLAELNSGTLDVGPGTLMLTGLATRAGREAALSNLGSVPSGIVVDTDISIADDGVPFGMTVVATGDSATAEGKLPFGMAPGVIGGVLGGSVDTSNVRTADIESTKGFPATAQAGLSALDQLQNGKLDVTETEIRLTGLGRIPADADAVDAILADVDDSVTKTVDLSFLDDGTPPAWALTYAAGAVPGVSGKLPAGLPAQDAVAALGFANGTLDAQEGLTGTPDAAVSVLQSVKPWMSRLEGLTVNAQGDDITVRAVAAPEEPLDALRTAMNATIDAPLTVVASPNAIALGTERVRSDGRTEVFTALGWDLLPEPEPAPEPEPEPEPAPEPAPAPEPLALGSAGFFDFDPSIDACNARSRMVLADAKINFVTSGSDVDRSSADTLALLARILTACLRNPDLGVEIAGHTDSRGSEDGNQSLSEARAASVLAEFGRLGVDTGRLAAIGYGELQPIADNETEEGRAANRRTEITWSTATTNQ
ncbi:MAG: OmpA family protein, partial [Pseudomonadota bacterium]